MAAGNSRGRVMRDGQFRKFLEKEKHMTIVQIPGDGNCLYSALALAMGEDGQDQQNVRDRIATHMKDNPLDYYDYVEDANDGYNQEINRTNAPREWGDEVQLRAASDCFGWNITVFLPNEQERRYPQEQHYERNAYLSFHNGNHYNMLLENISEDPDLAGQSGEDGELENDDSADASEISEYDDSQDKEPENLNEISDDDDETNDIHGDGENEGVGSHSEFNDMDSSSDEDCHSDDEAIMDKLGFKFLANKVYASGRKYVYMLILVPKIYSSRTLIPSIYRVNGKAPIFYTVSYSSAFYHDYTTDREIKKEFDVYEARKNFPLHENDFSVRTWYCNIMIPHVLLTAIQYQWKFQQFKFLFKSGRNTMIQTLLDEWWGCTNDLVKKEMEMILANPNSLFCEKCTDTCPFVKKPWHINLDMFSLNKDVGTRNTLIFSKMNTLHKRPNPSMEKDNISSLIRLYQTKENLTLKDKLLQAYETLDLNIKAPKKYWSYLLLILDGPCMTAETKFQEVEHDKSFIKCLYAGQTKSGQYREGHFTRDTTSPVYQILTSSCKVYLLRSFKFHHRMECRQDEAAVLETLKLTVQSYKQSGKQAPFVLLNTSSEPDNLLPSRAKKMKKILDFCKTPTPIFTSIRSNAIKPKPCVFEGSCYVGDPIGISTSSMKPFSADLYDKFKNN